MPVPNYGVLVGKVVDTRAEHRGNSPHFQILLDVGGTSYRVAVNTRSIDPDDPNLLAYIDRDFQHPVTRRLAELRPGFYSAAKDGPTLDFVRDGLVSRGQMELVRADEPGPESWLDNEIADLVNQAGLLVYAFGSRWGPEDKPDQVFTFTPGNGIHDIHMNQGSTGGFADQNGANQDGALVFRFGGEDRWAAIFLAFDSQIWPDAGASQTSDGADGEGDDDGAS